MPSLLPKVVFQHPTIKGASGRALGLLVVSEQSCPMCRRAGRAGRLGVVGYSKTAMELHCTVCDHRETQPVDSRLTDLVTFEPQ